jgi:hypothetical protein
MYVHVYFVGITLVAIQPTIIEYPPKAFQFKSKTFQYEVEQQVIA